MSNTKTRTIQIPNIPVSITQKLLEISYRQPGIQKNILLQVKGNQAHIIYNRPQKMNAFSVDMYLLLIEYLNWANENSQIKFIIISGAGKDFSSGNDLMNFSLQDMNDIQLKLKSKGMAECLQRVTLAIINSEKPIFALVKGRCIGFSFTQLALYDAVFAVQDTHFMAPLVRIAQGPQMCSSYTFPKIFGQSLAEQLIIKGKRISAKQLQKYNFLKSYPNLEQANKALMKHIQEISQLDWESYIKARKLMKPDSQKLKMINRAQCQNLVERWSNPGLLEYLMNYMQKRKTNKSKL